MAVSGTFASPEKESLIIDKSRLWNPGSAFANLSINESSIMALEDEWSVATAASSELQKPVK